MESIEEKKKRMQRSHTLVRSGQRKADKSRYVQKVTVDMLGWALSCSLFICSLCCNSVTRQHVQRMDAKHTDQTEAIRPVLYIDRFQPRLGPRYNGLGLAMGQGRLGRERGAAKHRRQGPQSSSLLGVECPE